MTEKKQCVVCIIQARTTSTRLPNKIFLELAGKPVLAQVIDRVAQSRLVDQIVIAAPDSPANDAIETWLRAAYPQVGLYRGSEQDVLDRYYQAATAAEADVVVRITSDCPLIDPQVVDRVIAATLADGVDYCA